MKPYHPVRDTHDVSRHTPVPDGTEQNWIFGECLGKLLPQGCGRCLTPTPVTFWCPDLLHRSLVHGASHLQSKSLVGIRLRTLVLGLSLIEAAAGIWGTAAACFPTRGLQPPLSRTSLAEGTGLRCGTSSCPRGREVVLPCLQEQPWAPARGRTARSRPCACQAVS